MQVLDPFKTLQKALAGTALILDGLYSGRGRGEYIVDAHLHRQSGADQTGNAIRTLSDAVQRALGAQVESTAYLGSGRIRLRFRHTPTAMNGLDAERELSGRLPPIPWRAHGDTGAIAESTDERLRVVIADELRSLQPNGPGFYIYVSSRSRGGPVDWTTVMGKVHETATHWERILTDGPYSSLSAAKRQASRAYAAWAPAWKPASQPLAGLAFDPGQQVEVKPTFRTGGLPRGKCTVVGPAGVPGMLQLACGGGMTSTVTAKKLRLAGFALLLSRGAR